MRSDMPGDHYGHDVLARNWRRPQVVPQVPAERDLVVEDAESGFCGAVVRCDKMPGGWVVTLADRHDKPRAFPLGPGFLIDGKPVVLTPPTVAGPKAPTRTASG
ncbi:DUF3097 family protein, partial [Sporichthya sp.]|uniref:DUF3097 family protein n=1 Tax=Sporichthya sp. TaxID=65475 RepID=UPI0025D1EAAF